MDITVINNIWRPVYGSLVKAIRVLTPEWENLKSLESFKQLSPRSINWPVDLIAGGGIVFTSDAGSTANATSNEPVEATDSWTHMAGRFEISYDALMAESDGKFGGQAIEKQLRFQAMDKARSFRKAIGIGFYGYPDAILFHATGVNSNPSGNQTKVRVDSLYGDAGALDAGLRLRDYFTVNKDVVAVHNAETVTIRGYGTVLAIDEANNDLTLDTASAIHASVADGDAIVLHNHALTSWAGTTDDLNLGLNGLLHLTTATTVHNISSASQPDWDVSVDVANYAAALSGSDAYEWFETIEQRSMLAPQWGYTTVGVIAAAGGTELDQRRYGASDDTMRVGFRKLNLMGVTLEGRPYCPAGHLFLGSNSALRKIAPDEDVKDLLTGGDRSGGFKQYDNQLGFYKDFVMRSQMAVVNRLGLGIVKGITEN